MIRTNILSYIYPWVSKTSITPVVQRTLNIWWDSCRNQWRRIILLHCKRVWSISIFNYFHVLPIIIIIFTRIISLTIEHQVTPKFSQACNYENFQPLNQLPFTFAILVCEKNNNTHKSYIFHENIFFYKVYSFLICYAFYLSVVYHAFFIPSS